LKLTTGFHVGILLPVSTSYARAQQAVLGGPEQVEAIRLSETEWLLEHSEVTAASVAFVWTYLTDVTNWADPPANFKLDGRFEVGSRGVTLVPERDPLSWVIEEVQPGSSYTIGLELDGAVLLCHWRFDPLPEGGTRLTQRIGVAGRDAARHAEGVRSGFEPTLAAGMKRIARQLAQAQDSS
jgi:Polyketide cyclase / dehydrase and lipid transport